MMSVFLDLATSPVKKNVTSVENAARFTSRLNRSRRPERKVENFSLSDLSVTRGAGRDPKWEKKRIKISSENTSDGSERQGKHSPTKREGAKEEGVTTHLEM